MGKDIHLSNRYRMVAANKVLGLKKPTGYVNSPLDKNIITQGYDIIILDLDMPIMNGYDACR